MILVNGKSKQGSAFVKMLCLTLRYKEDIIRLHDGGGSVDGHTHLALLDHKHLPNIQPQHQHALHKLHFSGTELLYWQAIYFELEVSLIYVCNLVQNLSMSV